MSVGRWASFLRSHLARLLGPLHPALGVVHELLLLLTHDVRVVLGRRHEQGLERREDLHVRRLLCLLAEHRHAGPGRRERLAVAGALAPAPLPVGASPDPVVVVGILLVVQVRLGATRLHDALRAPLVAQAQVRRVETERALHLALHVDGRERDAQVAEEPLLHPRGHLVVVEAASLHGVNLHGVEQVHLHAVPDLLEAGGGEVAHGRAKGHVERLLPEGGGPQHGAGAVLVVLELDRHEAVHHAVQGVLVVVLAGAGLPAHGRPGPLGAPRSLGCSRELLHPRRHVARSDDRDEQAALANERRDGLAVLHGRAKTPLAGGHDEVDDVVQVERDLDEVGQKTLLHNLRVVDVALPLPVPRLGLVRVPDALHEVPDLALVHGLPLHHKSELRWFERIWVWCGLGEVNVPASWPPSPCPRPPRACAARRPGSRGSSRPS